MLLFFPLLAIPLLQFLFSLSLLRYFSENSNTLLAIATLVDQQALDLTATLHGFFTELGTRALILAR
jgi:hypothetical protein